MKKEDYSTQLAADPVESMMSTALKDTTSVIDT